MLVIRWEFDRRGFQWGESLRAYLSHHRKGERTRVNNSLIVVLGGGKRCEGLLGGKRRGERLVIKARTRRPGGSQMAPWFWKWI